MKQETMEVVVAAGGLCANHLNLAPDK